MLQQGLLVHCPDIKAAFCLFLVSKSDGSAWLILNLSPWTDFYQLPPMKLYSAAEVLLTIPPGASLVKIDLSSGFFHFRIHPDHVKFYSNYYAGVRYAFTRLPMGHALAPSIMQRASQAVAAHLYSTFRFHMCAYLDDWLIWDVQPPQVPLLLQELRALGFTINLVNSTLQPATSLVYLGLHIDTVARAITPTRPCIQHLRELLSIVPAASPQDLRRIPGYVAWLAWAMAWPQFLSAHIRDRSTYWLRVLDTHNLFHQTSSMISPAHSVHLYANATPTSIAAITTHPVSAFYRRLETQQTIAKAEMAAAHIGLHWYLKDVATQPTTVTFFTDSSVVYHTLLKALALHYDNQLYCKICMLLF
jgi:glycerophosphoryl diester phosphodiesterase